MIRLHAIVNLYIYLIVKCRKIKLCIEKKTVHATLRIFKTATENFQSAQPAQAPRPPGENPKTDSTRNASKVESQKKQKKDRL